MKFTTSDSDGHFVVSGTRDIACSNNILIQRV